MRLADDERGRVPFALIGVFLLVSSVAIATVQLDQERIDRDAALAGDRASATAETVLRDTVRDAGERAAANPVVTPADNEWGSILDDDRPYRSYLELLVAIELRERLDGQSQRVSDATATVELSPIDDERSATNAVDAVTIEPAGRGMVEATVADVPIVLRKDGQRVGTRTRTLSANVSTPTLTLHERTATFQSKLNADSLADGTLNRGLTGGLWALAWPRGYGQYAGVPFENVVDNRHAELVTNLAVLDVQRSVFGHSDPEAEKQLGYETATAAANEGFGMSKTAFEESALPMNASVPIEAPTVESPDPEKREVGVDGTADRALADLLHDGAEPDGAIITEDDTDEAVEGADGGGVPSETNVVEGPDVWEFDDTAIVRTVASIDAALNVSTYHHPPAVTEHAPPTGPDWDRIGVADRGTPSPVRVERADAPQASVGKDWSLHRAGQRTVVLEWTNDVRYRNETSGRTESVPETYRQRVDVSIALVDRPVQRPWIPDATGPSPGSEHYRSLREQAAERLLAEQGGFDGVSEAVVTDEDLERSIVASPEDLDSIQRPAYQDVTELREEMRGISTTASPGHALTDDERPVAGLAGRIRDRSATYRGIPARYDGLDQRATVTLRSLYVDRVLHRLDARTEGSSDAREDISNKISGVTELSGVGLGELFSIGMDYSRPESAELSAREPAPNLTVTVDGNPSYLDTEATTVSDPPAPGGDQEYHPLGARTSTVASLPTDEVTSGITEAIVDVLSGEDEPTKVPLTVAAKTLRSGNEARNGAVESNLSEQDVDRLHEDVGEEVDEFVKQLATPLADETELSDAEARDVVDTTFLEYGGTDEMGPDDRFKFNGNPGKVVIATENGSLTTRIANRAANRSGVTDVEADRARTRMRAARDRYLAETDSQVKVWKVEQVNEPTREAISTAVGKSVDEIEETGTDRIESKILDRTRFSALPTRGFPVAPVPPWWYVTANVWHVEVHGTYDSFTVRADQGGPSGGGQVSYVRDGGSVQVDVNGDGRMETLGNADRIRFYATTTVAVAVPRGGGGVGNEAGGFVSKTDGWDPARGRENACRERPGNVSRNGFEVCAEGEDLEIDRPVG